jgi:hypothetical protein
MMVHLGALLFVAALATPGAGIDVSPLEAAFGNTILSTYPNGMTAALYLNRDGSYTGQSRRREFIDGRWSLRPGEVCFRQSRPFPIPFSICRPLATPAIGDMWAAKAVTGETLTVTLLAGRPTEQAQAAR